MRYSKSLFIFLFVSSALFSAEDIADLEKLLSQDTELKADVGSRSGLKNAMQSNTPIDVITSEQIEKTGLTSLVDVMRYFVAGFNAPEPAITDGSDHVRAYTLRGMSPDQILTLINGKRLHASSLLHINGTIGRGSAHADLDTLPVNMIERIEILRDGAAAQYGSDAIAGVVNIVLKGMGGGSSVALQNALRSGGDGGNLYASMFYSKAMRYDGFINIAAAIKKQEDTDNAGLDARAGVAPVRHTTKMGLPKSDNFQMGANIELPNENDSIVYANANINFRDSEANALYRAPSAYSTNGFLPTINPQIYDYRLGVGVKKEGGIVDWDISSVYGLNEIRFYVKDSMNYSLAPTSQNEFFNGSLKLTQNTTNFDFKKKIQDFALAGGAEYRYEGYKIKNGEESSYYTKMGVTGGAQGLSGYKVESAVDTSRNSYALYFDAKYFINSGSSLDSAVRYERYSDFGATTNYKLAYGYAINDALTFRTSASTGFRAPSLAQSNYSYVSSYTSSKSLVLGGIFRPSEPIAQMYGAKELKAEKSKHLAFGGVYRPSQNGSLTVDFFYNEVDDKIALSRNYTTTSAEQAAYGVSFVSFFTNVFSTKTKGVDIKYEQLFDLPSLKIKSSIWYNYNDNEVTDIKDAKITRSNSFREIDKLENGQPKHSAKWLNALDFGNFSAAVNINYFGSFKDVPPSGEASYNFDPIVTTDCDVSYKYNKNISFAVGGLNIFNAMHSKWDRTISSGGSYFYAKDGLLPYSQYSPMGFSGGYYYIKASVKF